MARHISVIGGAIRIALVVIILVGVFEALSYMNIISATTALNLVVSVLISLVIIEALGFLLQAYMTRGINKEEAVTLKNLFRIVAYIVLLLFVFYELNINITGLLVSAGFLGIVLGLAAQATLSNFIAGVYLLATDAFEPGDHVTIHTWQYTLQPQSYPHDKFIPGFYGIIKSIGLLYTELIDDENIPVYVPNNVVAQALVMNYGRAENKLVRMQFDVNTAVPFKKLEQIIDVELKKKGVKHHHIDIAYLHDNIYVVTIHMETEFKGRSELKSAIYSSILDYFITTRDKHPRVRAKARRHYT